MAAKLKADSDWTVQPVHPKGILKLLKAIEKPAKPNANLRRLMSGKLLKKKIKQD